MTETVAKTDYFLHVKLGRDAWLISGMLGINIQEDLYDKVFISAHTNGFEDIKPHFMANDRHNPSRQMIRLIFIKVA